jgi:hypothetical protein
MRRHGFGKGTRDRAFADFPARSEPRFSSPIRRRRFFGMVLPVLIAARTSPGAANEAPPRIGWLKIQGPQHTPDQRNRVRPTYQYVAAAETDRFGESRAVLAARAELR